MSTTPPLRRFGWFADRPIGLKIGSALAVLGIVSLALTTLAVSELASLERNEEKLYEERQ